MAMAITMREFLKEQDADFEVLQHPPAVSASRVAEKAHITGEQMAKAVLLKCDSGYRLAVVPGTCVTDLNELSHALHERLGLATEDEIRDLFSDCEGGALPPLGQAWGVPVWYDEMLAHQPDIYFEAGDHQTLVHMSGTEFSRLMRTAERGRFARHM